jgi:hypothetical protein
MKRAFLSHLKQEKKTNLYTFLEEVDAFEKLKQPKQLIKKLDQIFNTFIKEVRKNQLKPSKGSSSEIVEFSGGVKSILEAYHKEQTNPMYSTLWVLNESPKEIFSESKKVVVKILKLIQFAEVPISKIHTF